MTDEPGNTAGRNTMHTLVGPSDFPTTRWTLVIAAADTQRKDARSALVSLCEGYWYPLYAYIRRQGLADVGGDHAHVAPVTPNRNLKPVILRKDRVLFVAIRFSKCRSILLVMHVRDPPEEQQWEHVRLEIGRVYRAAKYVRSLPKVRFELTESSAVIRLCMAVSGSGGFGLRNNVR
jgi:hypothetical protein